MTIIDEIYSLLEDGYGSNHRATDYVKPTYGELTESGFGKIMSNVIVPYNCTFYDLGSGTGKVLMYATLSDLFDTIIGIEYVLKRHEIAKQAFLKLRDRLTGGIFPDVHLNKDTFFKDEYFSNPYPAFYFISNLCFSEDMNNKLVTKFGKRKNRTI